MKFKTWQLEAAFVSLVLVLTVILSGNTLKEWIGAAAVLFTFMHAQVSDRLAQKQAQMEKPDVPCHGYAARYYMMKEGLWIVYFILSQTWSALAGGFIFLLYPLWRKHRAKRR